MLKYAHQSILMLQRLRLDSQQRSHLALIASHSKFPCHSFITFWYHATVHRWRYLPAIVGHLSGLPVYSTLRLYVSCAPGDGQRHFFCSNSSGSFALGSLLSSCCPAIRRELYPSTMISMSLTKGCIQQYTVAPIPSALSSLRWSSNNSCCSKFRSNRL